MMTTSELNDYMAELMQSLQVVAYRVDDYRLKKCSTLGYYYGGRSGHQQIKVPVAGEREAKLARRWLLKRADELEELANEIRREIEDAERHAEWAKKGDQA